MTLQDLSSFFHQNKTGAAGLVIHSLTVEDSVFRANETGVAGHIFTTLSLSRNAFLRNQTAVLFNSLAEFDCVTVDDNRFVRNAVNVVGPVC